MKADFIKSRCKLAKNDPFFADVIEQLKLYFEREHTAPPPQYSYSKFMLFYTTGSRKEYELDYFSKRTRLAVDLLLYLMFNEDRYLNDIIEVIWSICSEHCWVLPAHTKNVPGDLYRTTLDLFACETAFQLAETYVLLGDNLPKNIRNIVRGEISSRVFDSFEKTPFRWENARNNWASVCGGSLAIAYLYLAPDRFDKVKDRIDKTMANYLDGFCNDGCTTEGVAYWFYGFSHYIYYADVLKEVRGEDILHLDRLKNIVTFIQKVVLRNNYTVSFSDGVRSYKFSNLGFLSYLKSTYDFFVMPSNCCKDIITPQNDRVKFQNIIRFFAWTEPSYFTKNNDADLSTYYLSDAQWLISKKSKFSFACKGGHNGEHHNHNDVGSFIFVTDCGHTFTDIGCMEYTKNTFDVTTRYVGYTEASSVTHSVPLVGEQAQIFGKNHGAKILNADQNGISMEIQDAYGDGLPKIIRSFKLDEHGVTLTDEFESGLPEITERFACEKQPEITSDGIKVGDALLVCDLEPQIFSHTFSNHACRPEEFWFIDFKVNGDKFTAKITTK